ncbi:MAG: DUF502 domain-containing protein [Thermoguttaceae bacterium]|jgi:uncharacterized membrane protein|nr:DUF502 domain-containing protein [Thermoguttaceae bacterium]
MRRLFGKIFSRAARCFLAGIIAILPLAITVAVVTWVGGIVSRFLGPSTMVGRALSSLGIPFATDATVAYAFGAALVVALIFVVGVAVEVGARNWLQRLLDVVLPRIPIIGGVYGTSKQLVRLVDKKQDAELKGMKAVFCFFGGQSGAGVLALLVSPERFRINGREYHIVVVPTAPVPIGGGLLFVPAETVQPADLSVEGLMSIYVSMGIAAPQFLPAAACLERTPPVASPSVQG